MPNGSTGKDPLGDIQKKIDTAAHRAEFASEIIATVISEGGNPDDARIPCESAEALLKSALQQIHLYNRPTR